MSETGLSSAKYYNESDPPIVTDDGGSSPVPQFTPPKPSGGFAMVSATRWISIAAGAMVVICGAVLAYPYLTAPKSKKPTNAFDMFLRFGGAKEDQTFEKWLTDSLEASEGEWDKIQSESPAFKFDPNQVRWNFDPPKNFK
jgi:hypothetical protein